MGKGNNQFPTKQAVGRVEWFVIKLLDLVVLAALLLLSTEAESAKVDAGGRWGKLWQFVACFCFVFF